MYFDHRDHHEHHDFHGHHHGHGYGHHGHHGEFDRQYEGGAEQQGETNSASVICPCMGVTESDIQRAVANRARTLEDVEDATGAGTRCGRCVGAIETCLQRELAAVAS